MPVVVLKQTVTVPLFSGTSTFGTLGTTVTIIEEREREDGGKEWREGVIKLGEGKEEKKEQNK